MSLKLRSGAYDQIKKNTNKQDNSKLKHGGT